MARGSPSSGNSGSREAKRRLSVEEYRAVFEAAPDGIVLVDEEGKIRDVNPRAEEMFGYERDELLGRAVEVLVPEGARSVHAEHRAEYMEEPRTRPMGIDMELRGRRKDGSEFPVEISLSPLRTDEGTLVVSIVRDVTDRKRLRQFGVGAVRAAEEERSRIARELHDDISQRVATLMIHLRLVQRAEEEEERKRLLEECRDQLQGVVAALRRTARGLRPPALEDAGVATALRSHVRERLTGTNLHGTELEVDLDAEEVDGDLSREARLALYRILQEALTNAIRHADASRVEIRVVRRDGGVVGEVMDDGRGFDVDRVLSSEDRGLGILGMEERAALVGAELELESEPGRGTRVRVVIPPTDPAPSRE